jgi:hypothetical protein
MSMVAPSTVSPKLVFPVIETVLESNKAMPASSMLFEMVKLPEVASTTTDSFVCPTNSLLSIDAPVSPKSVSMPFPAPGPELLLFWIRLYWTLV